MLKGRTILLTGATGLIGGEFLRLLAQGSCERILCLVRPREGLSASQRLAQRLEQSGEGPGPGEFARIESVVGDVTDPGLGLNPVDLTRLIDSLDIIVHCAAELSFINEARCGETNVAGMRNLIELTARCRRKPSLVHVSTATVCGMARDRLVLESDGTPGPDQHFNGYTRSKALAEQVLRESGVPALILRPSIVLSGGLPTESFARAIVWFLPLLNEFDALPIDPESRVDVVTVGFVVQAMFDLLRRPGLARDCYHLSAGAGAATHCGQIAEWLDAFYERKKPLRLLPPGRWTREAHRQYVNTPQRRKVFATLKHYLPFLNMNVAYDNSRLKAELGEAMPKVPPLTRYLGRLLELQQRSGAETQAARQAAPLLMSKRASV